MGAASSGSARLPDVCRSPHRALSVVVSAVRVPPLHITEDKNKLLLTWTPSEVRSVWVFDLWYKECNTSKVRVIVQSREATQRGVKLKNRENTRNSEAENM